MIAYTGGENIYYFNIIKKLKVSKLNYLFNSNSYKYVNGSLFKF